MIFKRSCKTLFLITQTCSAQKTRINVLPFMSRFNSERFKFKYLTFSVKRALDFFLSVLTQRWFYVGGGGGNGTFCLPQQTLFSFLYKIPFFFCNHACLQQIYKIFFFNIVMTVFQTKTGTQVRWKNRCLRNPQRTIIRCLEWEDRTVEWTAAAARWLRQKKTTITGGNKSSSTSPVRRTLQVQWCEQRIFSDFPFCVCVFV